jgi:CHAT domain-containing protein
MGRYADALSELQKALALAVQLKDLRMEAGDRTNLGNVEVFLGRYDDALGSQERAYAIDHALKFQVAEAEDDGNLGVIQMDLGRYPEALAFHQRALGIVTSRGDLRDESLALANIGSVEEYMERYSDALASLTKAMDIARKIENPRIAVQLFTQIGELEPALGNPTAGANDVLQALTLAKDIKDNADEANLLSSFGRLQSLEGDYSDALRTAKQAEDLDRELGDPEALWSSLQAVASAEAGLDQRVAAVADYGAAIDQLEQIRGGLKPTERASYIASRMAIYGAFIEYLRELDARYPNGGYGRKALDVFEREAGRSELEQLGASAAQHFFGVPPGVVEHEAVLETAVEDAQTSSTKVMSVASPDPASIAMVKATLTNAESAQRTFEAVVERRYSKYYTLRHPQPLDVNAFQSALRPGQILLTYDVSHHIAWVVTHDQFVFVPKLPSEPVIEKAVKALRDHVATLVSSGNRPNSVKETSAFARDSYTLYRMLMPEPVAAMMKGPGKSLIVVPSGALRQVPFAALVTQDPAVDPTHPHYLIEDIPISYASSGSLFVTVKEAYAHHRAAPQTLIAFANPTFPATGAFKPLPGSLTEANDTLASLEPAIEPASGAIVSGDDASLQRVRAMNKSKSNSLATYRYVLFATHAVLPDAISDVPPPAIVLAHPERGIDKSFLTMADVFNLSFNADFIMLSACKTGVGNAQGISGLTRSFLYAGTPAVAVTLWDVDQPAGPALTPTFFAGMRAGETSAQALKDAQVAMINSGDLTESHPYEWAPFVIYGDGDLATRT